MSYLDIGYYVILIIAGSMRSSDGRDASLSLKAVYGELWSAFRTIGSCDLWAHPGVVLPSRCSASSTCQQVDVWSPGMEGQRFTALCAAFGCVAGGVGIRVRAWSGLSGGVFTPSGSVRTSSAPTSPAQPPERHLNNCFVIIW